MVVWLKAKPIFAFLPDGSKNDAQFRSGQIYQHANLIYLG